MTTALARRSLSVVCTCCLRAHCQRPHETRQVSGVGHSPHEVDGPVGAVHSRRGRHVGLTQRRTGQCGSLQCQALEGGVAVPSPGRRVLAHEEDFDDDQAAGVALCAQQLAGRGRSVRNDGTACQEAHQGGHRRTVLRKRPPPSDDFTLREAGRSLRTSSGLGSAAVGAVRVVWLSVLPISR